MFYWFNYYYKVLLALYVLNTLAVNPFIRDCKYSFNLDVSIKWNI